jgi:hypothetical protein
MRLVLAVLLLASCTQASAKPAWPKMAEREADGGESLEPRAKASAVAAAAADEDKPAKVDEKKPAATPAKSDTETTKPASTTPTQAPEDIVITTEEIVIEIED